MDARRVDQRLEKLLRHQTQERRALHDQVLPCLCPASFQRRHVYCIGEKCGCLEYVTGQPAMEVVFLAVASKRGKPAFQRLSDDTAAVVNGRDEEKGARYPSAQSAVQERWATFLLPANGVATPEV